MNNNENKYASFVRSILASSSFQREQRKRKKKKKEKKSEKKWRKKEEERKRGEGGWARIFAERVCAEGKSIDERSSSQSSTSPCVKRGQQRYRRRLREGVENEFDGERSEGEE